MILGRMPAEHLSPAESNAGKPDVGKENEG